MKNDDELQHLLRSTTDHLDFAVADVIAGGTARGRRLRRRRTATTALAGLAAAAVIAPLAWVAALTQGDGGSTLAGPATTQPSPATRAAVTRIPAFDSEGVARELRAILEQELPAMTITEIGDDAMMNRSGSRATATLRDPAGHESSVEVQVWPAEEDYSYAEHIESICDAEERPDVVCSEVAGGTLAVEESSWNNDKGEPYVDAVVDLLTPDGLRVRAFSSNNTGTALETLSPERSEAPLTTEQVVEIATDARWIVEGELPEPPAQPPLRTLAVDTVRGAQEHLAELVRQALPDAEVAVTTAARSGAQVTAAVTVDDGQGPSHVQVFLMGPTSGFNFHSWLNGSGKCHEGCTENEQGKLQTYANHNDDKADEVGVYNVADFQRADGAWISVSSANTAVPQHEAITTSRTSPLLTVEQLTEIATSDVWVR